jgi:hypothetical protein
MTAVQRLLTDQHVQPDTALVVTRELMGASKHSVARVWVQVGRAGDGCECGRDGDGQ